MIETIKVIIEYLNQYYYGHRKFFLLAVLCAIYLFFTDKKIRNKFIIPLALIVFIVINPILYEKVFYLIVYRRLFWLFSDLILVSTVFVSLLKRIKNEYLKYVGFGVLCLGIVALGKYQYNKPDRFEKTISLEKLPYGVVEVCDYLLTQEEEPHVIFDEWISCYTRQYSPKIKQLFGRDATGYIADIANDPKYIYDKMSDGTYSEVLEYANDNNYKHVVLENNIKINEDILNKYGFKEVFSKGQYTVYQGGYETTLRKIDNWELTSYLDYTNNMCIFYTLYNQDIDYLIVIDGGYFGNNPQIRNVINVYGGKVDAWILTHYHPDHIRGFNNVYYLPNGIQINKIYISPMDYDYYLSVAKEHDYPDTYTQFKDITVGANNIEYLLSGDILDLGGLKLEVISAANDDIKSFSSDYPNDGSLVFKISGEEDSILFTADVKTKEMCDYLMDNHKDELSAKYLQVNHHGNNQFDYEFYEAVNPEIVLFDTPEWLYEENEGIRNLWKYFNNKGVNTYKFDTAPNRFEFK